MKKNNKFLNNRNKVNYIQYKGEDFPYREIWFEHRWNIVATNDLNEKVYGNGNYPSKEAQKIDEQILFYLNLDEITLPSRIIQRILKQNIV